MTMKAIIKKILDDHGWTTYRLAKELGTSVQSIDYVVKSGTKGVRLNTLCKLRRVSGLSWAQFGKELDREFLSVDSDSEQASR